MGSPLRRNGSSRLDEQLQQQGGGGPLPANARITPCRFHMRGYCRCVFFFPFFPP